MNRRQVFRTGGWAALLGLTPAQSGQAAPAAAKAGDDPGIYTRVGGRPFINLTATYTINGGTLTRPEVKRAMEEASYWPINLDELMDKVGPYLARKLGAEAAIVTTGCAAALTHATCGIIAGTDPEKMQQLPNLSGLKNEVVVARQYRNAYDHAVRAVGVKMVEVGAPEEIERAINNRTAFLFMLGTSESNGPVKLEHLTAAARKHNLPILVDAAADLPLNPNSYLKRGADLVGYSGGKILRGPQASGLLLGRADLIRAAWANSSPHHAFGRMMKVGKEEIMGLVAAIDVWTGSYDLQADYKLWEGWLEEIGARLRKIDGLRAELKAARGASPFPVLQLEWDPARIGLTAGEIGEALLGGSPRIMSHAEGDGHGFHIRPVSMKAGEARQVADRLEAILRTAPKGRAAKKMAAPAGDIGGAWQVEIRYSVGQAVHSFQLQASGNTVSGTHRGLHSETAVKGSMDGSTVWLRSAFRYEGQSLPYHFQGTIEGGGSRMSGEVELGEYGKAAWSATRS